MPPRRSTARRGRATQNTTPTPEPAPAPRRTRGRPRKAAAEPEPAADAAERVHALPTRANPRLDEATSRQVKLQVIRREDKEIIIGRIKLPTVNGAEHGFLLKRFDTNAIAGSSMFRLAFPYADAEAERAEMAYLEARFDTEVANGGLAHATHGTRSRKKAALPPGSTGVRLQGVWIPCDVAAPIAADYGLLEIVQPLLDATAVKIPGEATPVLNPDAATLARAADAAESVAQQATPTRVSKRVRMRQVEDETPPRRMTRRTRPSTNDVVSVLSPAQVDAQIREAQLLARGIAEEEEEKPRPSRKRRAEAVDSEAESEAKPEGQPGEPEGEPKGEPEGEPEGESGEPGAPEAKAEEPGAPEAKPEEPAAPETKPEEPAAPTAPTAPADAAVRVAPQRPRRRLARAAGVLAAGAAGAAALYAGGGLGLTGAVSQLQHLDYASALQAIQHNVASWNVASWLS